MNNRDHRAALLVVCESFFLSAYICSAKTLFNGQGTLFSSALLMTFVSLSLLVYSYPFARFERRQFEARQRLERKGHDEVFRERPESEKEWRYFRRWALCAIGGDIALFLAVTYNAPLAESSLLTRGFVLLYLAHASYRRFGQQANRTQWTGISIGLLASACIPLIVYLSEGGVFSGQYLFWGFLPAWFYFTAVTLFTMPEKTLLSRALLERLPRSTSMFWLNVYAIPLSIGFLLIAVVCTPGTAWKLPPYFWSFLPALLVCVLAAVYARYTAQGMLINPVFHDGLRYGVMLALLFSYDAITYLFGFGEQLSLGLLGALLGTVALSLLSTIVLFRACQGSTDTR